MFVRSQLIVTYGLESDMNLQQIIREIESKRQVTLPPIGWRK